MVYRKVQDGTSPQEVLEVYERGWPQLASTLLLLEALILACTSHPLLEERRFDSENRNLAPVFGGERDLRTMYLPPFQRACVDSLAIMTAYSVYDGVPAIANKREQQSVSLHIY